MQKVQLNLHAGSKRCKLASLLTQTSHVDLHCSFNKHVVTSILKYHVGPVLSHQFVPISVWSVETLKKLSGEFFQGHLRVTNHVSDINFVYLLNMDVSEWVYASIFERCRFLSITKTSQNSLTFLVYAISYCYSVMYFNQGYVNLYVHVQSVLFIWRSNIIIL